MFSSHNKSPAKKTSTPPPSSNPPKESLNDYKIIKNIGQGAFGEVYLAKLKSKDQVFAIKSISKQFLMRQKKQHHVFQEKLILQSLDFSFLVKLFKTFQDDQKIYFVLENITNGELSDYIRKKSNLKRNNDISRDNVCDG